MPRRLVIFLGVSRSAVYRLSSQQEFTARVHSKSSQQEFTARVHSKSSQQEFTARVHSKSSQRQGLNRQVLPYLE